MSELNRPYTAYLMDALAYSRNLRRARQYALSLLEIYELIPDLEPDMQDKLSLLEGKIEAIFLDARAEVEPGNEYAVSVEVNEKIQEKSRLLLREARRSLMIELMNGGYFEYEKTSKFHNPSENRESPKSTAGFGATVKRTI
jgi:hypothetical protein